MTGDPTQTPAESRFKPMTLTLVGVALLAAWMTLLPHTCARGTCPRSARWRLFAAARLGFWPAVGFSALALGIKDIAIYLQYGWPPDPSSWFCFGGYVVLGWAFLRRTESPVKIGSVTLVASLIFFLLSELRSWLEQSLPYGYSLAGLADCYAAAIPFYRGTLVGDLVFTGGLFAAHAALSRAYFPAERVAVLVTDPNREVEGRW